MLPSFCWTLSFPLGMEYSVLKAGWLQKPKYSLVFKSSQNFFGLFPFIKKARKSCKNMLGGDSSSSQWWGVEEDEVVFLKQVALCPISPPCQEAGADLSCLFSAVPDRDKCPPGYRGVQNQK